MDPLNPSYNPDANVSVEEDCLVGGCLLPYACNYDPTAEYLLIETCDFDSCAGCTDTAACSYDPDATLSNLQDCDYPIDEYPELSSTVMVNVTTRLITSWTTLLQRLVK